MQNDTQATTEQLLEMANARIRDLENILTACREYGDEHRLRGGRGRLTRRCTPEQAQQRNAGDV